MKLNQYEWDPEKDKLGEGTFAEVFKAKDIYANRQVALKIYKTSVKGSTTGSTGQSKYSLEQEFQNIEAISHTNIITYYGLNYIKHVDAMGREGSHPVIIMEYANQGTLTEFLRTNPKREIVNKLIKDIIAGVGHLHEEGVIHRDLKPGNILVAKNKRGVYTSKITDFGISKDTLSSNNLTKSHTELIGTPHYMAPEQIYQKKYGLDGKISTRTDLWAVGVIIYKAFTGKLPFADGIHDIELVREAITAGEFDLTGVPTEYHNLLKQCFKKNAKERIPSASQMLNLIGETESTYIESGNDIDKTVIIPRDDSEDGRTIDISNSKDENDEISFVAPSKTQKIITAIFGLATLLWFGYYWFTEENTPYVYLLYPLTIILFCFLYLKPNNRFIIPKFFINGLMMYYNIFFVMFIGIIIFEGNLESKSILNISFVIIFQVGLSIWLMLKQIGNGWKVRANNMGLTGFLLSISVLVYLISYLLYIYDDTLGVLTVLLIKDDLTVLTLLPNVFFTTGLLFFVFKRHKKNLWYLLTLFIASISIASIWWLLLDYDNGYKISLISSYMQELKSGYYLWFSSIFVGFSVILYDSVSLSKFKKMYWPILGIFILTFGVSFYTKWSTSMSVFDFNRGIKNVDYNQFKKAFNTGKPLNVSSYELNNSVKNILGKYTNDNANTIRRMLKLFVNSNGTVTYIKDADLASAITKEDPELLEILLNPTGSTKLEDVVDFVDGEKSLLQMARDLENKEIEALLIKAGAKLTAQEKEVVDLKKSKTLKAKQYSYLENFAKISTSFPDFSDENKEWKTLNGTYQLYVKNDKRSYNRTANFNFLDINKTYTVSVKVEKSSFSSNLSAGLVFDAKDSDFHVFSLQGNQVKLYRYEKGNWKTLKEVNVVASEKAYKLKILKSGDYVYCYLNDKAVISLYKINSFNGSMLGMISPISKANDYVYFDDFKVTGTQK